MLGRNMRPNSREGSVLATSMVILTAWPWLLVMIRVVRVRGGAAVRVASEPGMGVPARAVGGTQEVVGEAGTDIGTGVKVGAAVGGAGVSEGATTGTGCSAVLGAPQPEAA